MILRYVPPLKRGLKTAIFISFFVVALILYLTFIQFGFIAILVFSVNYALFMGLSFYTLSVRYYLELDEDNRKIIVHRFLKQFGVEIDKIIFIDIIETNRSYLFTFTANGRERTFALSGSLSFEEPSVLPFLRKIQKIKPNVGLGEYCQGVLHGAAKFNPWSAKMYYTYWTYIGIVIAYYLFLLLFINILK